MTTAPAHRTARRVGVLLALALLGAAGCGKTGSVASTATTVAGPTTTATAGSADGTTTEAPPTTEPTTVLETTTAPGLSHDEFVVAGNAVCTKVNGLITALGNPSFPTTGTPTQAQMDQLADFLEKVRKLAVQEDDELRALDVPSADAEGLAAAVQLNEDEIGEVVKAIAELRAGDATPAVARINGLDNGPVNAAFDALGLRKCGSDS